VHVAGGSVGVSAVLMASAEAFTVLKQVGAAYLIWLGIRTIRQARLSQFVDPGLGEVAIQFAVPGLISVTLNTLAVIVVVYMPFAPRGLSAAMVTPAANSNP
jgi:threonine/homoserine/homoserine lactone efflux protein